jgi:hypothetical protein
VNQQDSESDGRITNKMVRKVQICQNGCNKIIFTEGGTSLDLTTGNEHFCSESNSESNVEPSLCSARNFSNTLSSDAQIDTSAKLKRKNTRKKPKFHDRQAEWIIDKTFEHLVNIRIEVQTPSGKFITVSKYYYQAWNILRDMRDRKILHPFPIIVSDLPLDLICTLLNSHRKYYIISQVVENILKNSNLRLYELVTKVGLRYNWIFLQ